MWFSSTRVSLGDASSAEVPRDYPVGVEYDPSAAATLIQVYDETIEAVKELHVQSAYRRNVEIITRHRRGIVASALENRKEIEQRIGIGRVEQVLQSAQDELALVAFMREKQPWTSSTDKSVPLQILD